MRRALTVPRAANGSSNKKKQAHLGVACSFLLKFPQRPCCSGLWKGTSDFFEKQNIFHKSFPEGLGCLQHLENSQVGVNSSTAWRSDQVYNLWAGSRASMPNISPRVALAGEIPLRGDFIRRGRWLLIHNHVHLCKLRKASAEEDMGSSAWGTSKAKEGSCPLFLLASSSAARCLLICTHFKTLPGPRHRRTTHVSMGQRQVYPLKEEELNQPRETLSQRGTCKHKLWHHRSGSVGCAFLRRRRMLFLFWACKARDGFSEIQSLPTEDLDVQQCQCFKSSPLAAFVNTVSLDTGRPIHLCVKTVGACKAFIYYLALCRKK